MRREHYKSAPSPSRGEGWGEGEPTPVGIHRPPAPHSTLSPHPSPLKGEGRSRAGFTLIELLVVLSVIALLLSLAAPRYFQHVDRSKEAVLKENLATVRDAIDQYHADTNTWPDSLSTLVERRYLRAVPTDPVTDSNQTWLEVPAKDGEAGIQDIHSGAEGTAQDGSAYAEW